MRFIRRTRLVLFAAMAIPAGAQVPVLDCAAFNSQTNQITAFFGYSSNSSAPTNIPLGADNFVDALGLLHGSIPIAFPQTAEHVLFSVTFSSTQSVGWHLNGVSATADSTSVTSPCQTAV